MHLTPPSADRLTEKTSAAGWKHRAVASAAVLWIVLGVYSTSEWVATRLAWTVVEYRLEGARPSPVDAERPGEWSDRNPVGGEQCALRKIADSNEGRQEDLERVAVVCTFERGWLRTSQANPNVERDILIRFAASAGTSEFGESTYLEASVIPGTAIDIRWLRALLNLSAGFAFAYTCRSFFRVAGPRVQMSSEPIRAALLIVIPAAFLSPFSILWGAALPALSPEGLILSVMNVTAEELVFRVAAVTVLYRLCGPAGAVVLAGIAFSAVHLVPPTDAVLLAFLGTYLGVLWLRYRSLAVCIVCHLAYNGMTLIT